jgi:catechol 2,3-dioxygenase-like lactoylglutathione lyase family enzyme
MRRFSSVPLRISHVSLRVRDLESSARFYCEVFGLVRAPASHPDLRACRCLGAAGNGHESFVVELVQGRPPEGLSTLDHFSIEVDVPESAQGIYQRALDRNARATALRLAGEWWRCVIFDPDGHKVGVVARVPRDQE